jgi:hypothetical protein
VGRLLIWISGASADILRGFPGDRAKYVGIGAAILITSSIAAVSMTFALVTALNVPVPAAIPFALGWGLVILSIDRWLVVSLQRQPHWWGYLTLALPRVLLGLLFGIIISTPFVLVIFQPEIKKEISLIETQRANAYTSMVKTDALTKKIHQDQAEVTKLEDTINSGGGPVVDVYKQPAVESLVHQRNQAQKAADSAYRQWQCQLYGIPKGSCKPGNGPLAMASHQRYLNDIAQVRQDNQEISAERTKILAANKVQRAKQAKDAAASLPAARAQLKTDRRTQAAQIADFNAQNANHAGLLLHLQALDAATAHNSTLNDARLLLWLFFTVIECLPVGVKVLLLLGPENAYEQAVAFDERTRLRTAREEALQRQEARFQAADIAREEENQLLRAREAAMPAIVKVAVDAEQEVAKRTIENWRQGRLGSIGDGQLGPRASNSFGSSGASRGPMRSPAADGPDPEGAHGRLSSAPPTWAPGRSAPTISPGPWTGGQTASEDGREAP